MTIEELLAALWADYVASTPQAQRIHDLLAARGETIRNDHIALRTYGVAGLDVDALAAPFEALGWEARERYWFADKHLYARYWAPPDDALPKVFISELVMRELSPAAHDTVMGLVAQLPHGFSWRADLPWCGRPWRVTLAEYRALLAESEYAAWLAAFGFRVNHFTVDFGSLRTFADLPALNAFLAGAGFTLNDAGGTVKGTRADRLEQSSTRADAIEVAFADGTAKIPSCYYEFARRYDRFEGFVPSSANKIFESTDTVR